MLFANDGEYFGRFENGKRHGEGVFTYKKTKDIYSGSWKFGKKHGKGTYIFDATKMKVLNLKKIDFFQIDCRKLGQWRNYIWEMAVSERYIFRRDI